MKNYWKSLFLASGVIAVSGAAMAADIVKPPPVVVAKPVVVVVPKAYDWSGTYLGIQGGYDTNHLVATPTIPPGPFTGNANGAIAGIFGGVNVPLSSNLILGFDASINYDWARTHSFSPSIPASFTAGPDWKGFLRAKIGMSFDTLLVYATGGAAVMHFKATCTDVVPGCIAGTATATPWGWTAGLGADMALGGNLFAQFDYAYSSFGKFTISGTGSFNGTPVTDKANTFTIGLGTKF